MEKPLEIKMDLEMVLAFLNLLQNAKPKGRSEMRNHCHLFNLLNSGCRKFTNPDEFIWHANIITITDRGAIEYLLEILPKRIDDGIPGSVCLGYNALFEITEAYDKERKEEAEKKKKEKEKGKEKDEPVSETP